MKKITIDYNVDPHGWFHLMHHTADLHNHRANKENENNLLPLNSEKGEVGDIKILNKFHFNEGILYQEYDYKYPEDGRNDSMGKWYGQAPNIGDKMYSCILTKGNELIVQSNIHYERVYQLNETYVNEIDTPKLKGSSKHDPIVHYLNELAY